MSLSEKFIQNMENLSSEERAVFWADINALPTEGPLATELVKFWEHDRS